MFEPPKELAVGREDIDVSRDRDHRFPWLAFLVEGEGDDDIVTDGLDIERHEVPGELIVGKELGVGVSIAASILVRLQSGLMEGVVVDIHGALVEVGGVEVPVCRRQ